MQMVPKLVPAALIAALGMAVSGCTPPGSGVAQAPVTDPYVATGDGGARYVGATPPSPRGGLPGAATPAAFAATAGANVSFAADQAVLSDEARAAVARQAAWLTRNRSFRALIEGHADEQGTREFNLALGARRAAAVQEYLIAQGVEPARITTVSYGNERPIADCATPECAARNRRTVTTVSPGAELASGAAAAPALPADPAANLPAAVPAAAPTGNPAAGFAPVPGV